MYRWDSWKSLIIVSDGSFFASANFARAIAAAAVRFSTLSLIKMRWTCLQIVPVPALRITPIS